MTVNQFEFYIKKFDDDFRTIMGVSDFVDKGLDEAEEFEPENLKKTTPPLQREFALTATPEHDTLDFKLQRILGYTNYASNERYMSNSTPEVILANLILQILSEIAGDTINPNDDLQVFQSLSRSKKFNLDEALCGFEFYENNPHREKAERSIARLRKKRCL